MTVSFKVSAVEGALLHPKSPIESWFTRLTFKADSQASKNNLKKNKEIPLRILFELPKSKYR